MTPPPAFEAPAYVGSAKLAGKVALITGGDSGIGRAAAVLFAREGVDVAIGYLAEEQEDAERTAAAVPHLGNGAAIVNVGSVTGQHGSAKLIDYASTKGAIHAFTKSLAQSLVGRGIRVNAVAPGPVWTPLNVADRPADEVATFGSQTPMGRPAQPEEIAPAIVFFASSVDSGFITGEVLSILGGQTTAG